MRENNIIWKVIKEAPEYEVSNYGDVRSLKTQVTLAGSYDKNGYPRVTLCTKGPNGDWETSKRITRFRHRLVAMAFLPNPKNLPQVNHIDENKKNSYVGNLEWCTAKYNVNYGEGAKNRRINSAKADKHGYFKEGKNVYVYDYETHEYVGLYNSITAAAKELDCDYRTIYKMVYKDVKQNQHHGMIFSFTPIEFDN